MEARVDSAPGGGSTKVLVVDDHDGFRTGLAAILAEEGLAVDAASSGEAALARAAQIKPDVVLMDADLPGMSGAEAARRLLRVIGSVRVVMIGFHDDGRLEALRCGAHGYLSKAAPLEDVLVSIRAAAHADRESAGPASAAPSAHRDASSAHEATVDRRFVEGEAIAA